MSVIIEFQDAIATAIKSNGSLDVLTGIYYGLAPDNVEYPYATLLVEVAPILTQAGRHKDVTTTINIFSKEKATKEIDQIVENLIVAFEGSKLDMPTIVMDCGLELIGDFGITISDQGNKQATLVFNTLVD